MQFRENKLNLEAGNLVLILCSLSAWLRPLFLSEPQLPRMENNASPNITIHSAD